VSSLGGVVGLQMTGMIIEKELEKEGK